MLSLWAVALLVVGALAAGAAERERTGAVATDRRSVGLPTPTSPDGSTGPTADPGVAAPVGPAPPPGTEATAPVPDPTAPVADPGRPVPDPADPSAMPGPPPLDPTRPPFTTTCAAPSDDLTDPAATLEARCAYAAIEAAGQGRGDLPVGQQLLTSALHRRAPVSDLVAEVHAGRPAATPAVIGTDLDAILHHLDKPNGEGEPTVAAHLAALVEDSRAGRLVTMSWHARSPFTGGPASDDAGVDLRALLDPTTAAGQAWARQTDQAIGVLRRFADAGVPVAFRPLHEANLSAFWWGQADPDDYRAVWEQLRQRFEAAGVHNVIWVFSPNHPHSPSVPDPLAYTPERFDVFGIDTYDPEQDDPTDRVRLSTRIYERIVDLGRPFALTEVGPLGSGDGQWDPATITDAVSERYPATAWALLWATFSPSARMAIVDLDGHDTWWSACDGGTCPTTRPP